MARPHLPPSCLIHHPVHDCHNPFRPSRQQMARRYRGCKQATTLVMGDAAHGQEPSANGELSGQDLVLVYAFKGQESTVFLLN